MLDAREVCLLGSMVLVMGVIIKAVCVVAYWRACMFASVGSHFCHDFKPESPLK